MRLHTKRAVFLLLLFAFASDTLSAQRTVPNPDNPAATSGTVPRSGNRHEDPAAARLLSLDEGLSVLGAALESRAHLGAKSDCSHLVHAVYERAGFPYPYASSSDLYVGISEFHRVTRPQPGDLAAWPGHVGIAISPVQHSFYSALHSGLGVEKYDAPYWRERGRARFYRYVKAAPATLNAANARVAHLTPTTLGSAESHGDQEKAGMKTQSPAAPPEAEAANQPLASVPVVDSERPSAGEITEALSQAFSDTAEALRGKDVLVLRQPLIVFDQLEVEQVRIERGQGWAAVRIRRPLPVMEGQVKHGKRPERQQWLLRHRDQNGWEVVLPQGDIYLPRNAAVRVLAHQLTDITDGPGSAQWRVRESTASPAPECASPKVSPCSLLRRSPSSIVCCPDEHTTACPYHPRVSSSLSQHSCCSQRRVHQTPNCRCGVTLEIPSVDRADSCRVF